MQFHLYPAWKIEQQKGEHAKKCAFVSAQHYLAHHRNYYQQAQYIKSYKGTFVFPELTAHRFAKAFLFQFFLFVVFQNKNPF